MPTINVKRVLTWGSFLPEMGVFLIKATNCSVRNKPFVSAGFLISTRFILLSVLCIHNKFQDIKDKGSAIEPLIKQLLW